MEGTIKLVGNRYYINNIEVYKNRFYKNYFPNDIVKYDVVDKKCKILSLVTRPTTIITLGVWNNECMRMMFPLISPFSTMKGKGRWNIGDEQYYVAKIEHEEKSIISSGCIEDCLRNIYEYNSKCIIPKYIKGDTSITPNIRDLRDLDTFNIDPVCSKDYDDAISVNGDKIYVHIVDIHQLSEMNSDEDINALRNSYTLYLDDKNLNNYSVEMSENKYSLIVGQDRSCITIEIEIDDKLEVKHWTVYKSIICVKNRYNYEDYNNKYELLDKFCNRWKINKLCLPNVVFNNDIVSLEYNNNTAHIIIETLMILCNKLICKLIGNCPQRYHPSTININKNIGDNVVDDFLNLKKYKNAEYSSSLKGHFGLDEYEGYTHFTSPIRRYFDVIIHRMLHGIYYENMEEIIEYLNKREKLGNNIYKYYDKYRKLKYLESMKDKTLDGNIISSNKYGFGYLITNVMYEDYVNISKVRGSNGENIFDHNSVSVGNKVEVKIMEVDVVCSKVQVRLRTL